MLEFMDYEAGAQVVAVHYAITLKNEFAYAVLTQKAEISSKKDAEALTRFYWEMVDQAVDDQENGTDIQGVSDLQFWMEKLLNIIMGYLKSIGMADVWNDVSDEVNGR